MEDPQALARAHVEAAYIALLVRLAARRAAGQMRGADDDDVLRDDRRRVQADLTLHEVHDLVIVLLQIDDAVLAEPRHERAGLGVERDELVARRHVENSLLAAVGPVREPSA